MRRQEPQQDLVDDEGEGPASYLEKDKEGSALYRF